MNRRTLIFFHLLAEVITDGCMITSVAYIISLANVYGQEKKRLGFRENETSNFV